MRMRAVVAELPGFNVDLPLCTAKPRNPRPPITIEASAASQMSTPSCRRMARLFSMSSDWGKLRIVLVPSARAAAKAARWAIALSPGGRQTISRELVTSKPIVTGVFSRRPAPAAGPAPISHVMRHAIDDFGVAQQLLGLRVVDRRGRNPVGHRLGERCVAEPLALKPEIVFGDERARPDGGQSRVATAVCTIFSPCAVRVMTMDCRGGFAPLWLLA